MNKKIDKKIMFLSEVFKQKAEEANFCPKVCTSKKTIYMFLYNDLK